MKCSSGETLGPGIHIEATWHTPRTQAPLQTRYPALVVPALPDGIGPLQLDNALCHMAETAQNWSQKCDEELEASELPDPSLIDNLWDVNEVYEGPNLDRTWLRLVRAWTQDVLGCSVVWDQLDWELGNLEAWSMCSAVCHVFQANREQFL